MFADSVTPLCSLAELVAAILKQGGLIDAASNPGAATPENLHTLFKNRASTTANPYVLRQQHLTSSLTTESIVQKRVYTPPALAPAPHRGRVLLREERPRSALRVVSGHDMRIASVAQPGINFTLESLKMGGSVRR